VEPLLKDALEQTGLTWDVVEGKRHHHIRLEGKLVGILPKGSHHNNRRATLNLRSQIRRAAEEFKNE